MMSSCSDMSSKKSVTRSVNGVWKQDPSYRREHYSLNSLWACWYAALTVVFQVSLAAGLVRANTDSQSLSQVYIVSKSIQRFTSYLSLSWPKNSPTYRELHVYVILTGAGVVLMPFFVVATMMKIGNQSNDGEKIGSKKTPHSLALEEDDCIYANCGDLPRGSRGRGGGGSLLRSFWRHTLPVGGLIHAVSAICFLLPRILMEAQLISHGLLPRGESADQTLAP